MRTSMLTIFAALTWSASAMGAMMVDINHTSSAVTQSGWIAVNRTGAIDVATEYGEVDIAFSSALGSAVDSRNRAVPTVGDIRDVMRDIIFVSGRTGTTEQGTLDVTLAGLQAGPYEFTALLHDSSVNHVSSNLLVSVDGGITFADGVLGVLNSTGTAPAQFGMATFNFVAGPSPVVVRVVGTGGTPGTAFTYDTAILSGFTVTAIPEPATSVLALGSLAIAASAIRLRKS
jgi:hypothetical protein